MKNPILNNRKSVGMYFLIWLLLAGLEFAVFGLLLPVSKAILLTDLVVQNFLFGLFLIGLWQPVRFMNIETQAVWKLIINHLSTFLLLCVIWVSLCNWILGLVFTEIENTDYGQNSLLFKVPFCFFGYLVFVSTVNFFKYYQSYFEKKEIEIKLNQAIKEAELSLLRSQMNPHFIFNSLNSISSLTLFDADRAHDMIIKLSDFLRYTVSYGYQQMVTLEKELEMCEAYLEIEKIRFGSKVAIEMKVENEAKPIEVPSLVLQTLFENAMKHGVHQSVRAEKICFEAKIHQNYLEIELSNTFDEPKKTIGTKTGLLNIKKRIDLIYNNQALFQTETKENKFIVKLRLPLQNTSTSLK